MSTVFNDVTVTSPCQLQLLVLQRKSGDTGRTKRQSVIFKCSEILYKSTGMLYLLMQKILLKKLYSQSCVFFIMLLHDQLMISRSYAWVFYFNFFS